MTMHIKSTVPYATNRYGKEMDRIISMPQNLQIHQRDALQFLTQLLSLKIILLDTDMNVVTLIVDFLIKRAQEYVSKQGVTKMEINVTKKEVTAHGLNYEIKHI